jgi:hypothetical protein
MKMKNLLEHEWLYIFGDVDFRGDCPSESGEQISFVNWVRQKTRHGNLIIHVRNEGLRSYMQTQRHKAEGMCTGAADIIIPAGITFVCELKRRDHTKSTFQKGQIEFLKAAHDEGAFVCVALGNDGAKEAYDVWNTLLDSSCTVGGIWPMPSDILNKKG